MQFALALLLAQMGQAIQPLPQPLAFVDVSVVDTRTGIIHDNMVVITVDDCIDVIGKVDCIEIPQSARRVKATGRFLIPGLWDMHIHILNKHNVDRFSSLLLANGVTGVRDMGGLARGIESARILRLEEQTSKAMRPRIVAAGAVVDGPPVVLGPLKDIPTPVLVSNPDKPRLEEMEVDKHGFLIIRSGDYGRHVVDTLVGNEVDFIKVYSHLSRESYFAIADQCKRRSIPFAGHVPAAVTALEASDAGQHSFEHLLGVLSACSRDPNLAKLVIQLSDHLNKAEELIGTYDESKARVLFERFLKNGTWQCPTLIALRPLEERDDSFFKNDRQSNYLPLAEHSLLKLLELHAKALKFGARTPREHFYGKRIFAKQLEILGKMHRMGVKILAGTDTAMFSVPGFNLHDELELFVRAGMSPLEALQTATLNPAEYLGREQEFGAVEVGKRADLVLLKENPLSAIGNTRSIAGVVSHGHYLSDDLLKVMLLEIKANDP